MRQLAQAFAALGLVISMWTLPANAAEKIKPQPVGGQIEWVYDYAAGQQLARQTGKPLFVVFRCER